MESVNSLNFIMAEESEGQTKRSNLGYLSLPFQEPTNTWVVCSLEACSTAVALERGSWLSSNPLGMPA